MTPQAELPLARIRTLAQDARFIATMQQFYERLDASIAAHRPVCRNRGACCRFGEFGHRLYVTSAELAYFVATTHGRPAAQASGGVYPRRSLNIVPPAHQATFRTEQASGSEVCPYQIDGLCQARVGRPMGCRVFFCESAGAGWQELLTESGLHELRALHDKFELPYAYAEWLQALAALDNPLTSDLRPLTSDF